jgi:heme exporter protein D
MFFVRLAAALTVVVLVGLIVFSRLRENRRRHHAVGGEA